MFPPHCESHLIDVLTFTYDEKSSLKYDEKTAENYRNCYAAKKRIISKLSKISILNFDSTN